VAPYNSESLLLHMLTVAGVDETRPNPAIAWEVFKKYVEIPVECARDYLCFQVGDGRPKSKLGGYFDFYREFEMRGEKGDEPVWFEQVHVGFKIPPKLKLGVGTITLFSLDYPDYLAFFDAVEQSLAFQAGLDFRGFELSVYHTGV